MFVRTLTPSSGPRTVVVPDELIGVRRYGTYVEPSAPAEHTVTPAASMAMANRRPNIPEAQKLDLPTQQKATGMRIYDRAIDAWVRPPVAIDVCTRAPRPSIAAYDDGQGDPYWIMCRATGVRMRRICAQNAARAAQIASEYAINHGLAARDAYAMKAD